MSGETPAKPGASRPNGLIRVLTLPLLALVYFYRYVISPLIGPSCRFQPTCSEYALDALKLHGPVKGTWLTVKRISKCHPWGSHGYDPVPGAHSCCNGHGKSAAK
ncbi:MAG: membrane protein insertion efficiency factor YidD [Alphaproteobacteria bacterium]|nr:membrane protein insertion efficiency factor YidD [Alphaproteobacteria bacterium SS10]